MKSAQHKLEKSEIQQRILRFDDVSKKNVLVCLLKTKTDLLNSSEVASESETGAIKNRHQNALEREN